VLADKSPQLIVDALTRAAADVQGLPLHGNNKRAGLFPITAAARQAAQRCKQEGFLRIVPRENGRKTTHETYAISEKGLAYLLDHASPKEVLREMVQTLEAYKAEISQLVAVAQKCQDAIDALRANAERVLQRTNNPAPVPIKAEFSVNGTGNWLGNAVSCLSEWHNSGHSSDCSLPELYRHVIRGTPGLTIGHFHDGLRRLYEQEKIYLHPWTGPLYEMPVPPLALLVGHEIAYYASAR
jgi:hypothetical protein